MAEKLLHTPLCDMLGIKYPILLAGMGGASTPELAAAVSNAGGLGILGAAALGPDELSEWIQRTRKLTDKPFGVDTLLPSTVPSEGSVSQFRAELPQSHIDFAKKFKERHKIPDSDPSKSRIRRSHSHDRRGAKGIAGVVVFAEPDRIKAQLLFKLHLFQDLPIVLGGGPMHFGVVVGVIKNAKLHCVFLLVATLREELNLALLYHENAKNDRVSNFLASSL